MNWFPFFHERLTNLRLTMQWPHPAVSPDNDVFSLLMTSFVSVCTGSLHIHVTFLPSFKLKTPDIWSLSHFSCVNSTAHRSSHSICRAHNIHHLMTVPLGTQTAWNNSLFTAVIARECVQKSLLLLRRLFQRSGFEFWISLSFFSSFFFNFSHFFLKLQGFFFWPWMRAQRGQMDERGTSANTCCEKTHAAVSASANQNDQGRTTS